MLAQEEGSRDGAEAAESPLPLLLGTQDGSLRAVDVGEGKAEALWSCDGLHQGPVTCVAVLNAAEGLVVCASSGGGEDGSLAVVDSSEGVEMGRLGKGSLPRAGVAALSVARDASRVLVAGGASVVLLDGNLGRQLSTADVEGPPARGGALLAALSSDGLRAAVVARGALEVALFEVKQGGTRRKPTEELKPCAPLELGLAVESVELLGDAERGYFLAALGAGGMCKVVRLGGGGQESRTWDIDLSGGEAGATKGQAARSRKRKSPPGAMAGVFSAVLDPEGELPAQPLPPQPPLQPLQPPQPPAPGPGPGPAPPPLRGWTAPLHG